MASAGGVFFSVSLPFGQKSRKSGKFYADARTAVGNDLQDLQDFASRRRAGEPGAGASRDAEGVEDGFDLHPGEDALAFLVAQLHEGVHSRSPHRAPSR